jgi:hypothetical protein
MLVRVVFIFVHQFDLTVGRFGLHLESHSDTVFSGNPSLWSRRLTKYVADGSERKQCFITRKFRGTTSGLGLRLTLKRSRFVGCWHTATCIEPSTASHEPTSHQAVWCQCRCNATTLACWIESCANAWWLRAVDVCK